MHSSSTDKWLATMRSWMVVGGMVLMLMAFAAIGLWHLRQDALDSQARELRVLSLALTDELNRGLQSAEEGLAAVQLELHEGRLPLTGPEAVRSLKTRADLMPLVRTIWLLDAQGHLLSCSDATAMPLLASFSPALKGIRGHETAISRPFLDPVTHTALVTLAVPYARASGAVDGWILAGIPADLLLGAFSVASPAPDARMAVYRNDGVLLVGSIVEKPTLDEAQVARTLASMSGAGWRKFRDGSQRLVTAHSLPRNGLKVVLTRDLHVMLTSWREVAKLTAGGLALLLAGLLTATYLVRRADHRHVVAKAALRAQQTRANKLESLGSLAGGVAHDFNNVLAAIMGYAEMAQDTAASGSHQFRQLDKVLQAAQRGKALVERILAFSRGGGRISLVFEVQPIVEEVLTLLSASLRPGLVLAREFNAPGVALRGDPTQIFEAVMNLCANAMQAMPDGGMVGVRLQRRVVASPLVLSHTQLAAGSYVVLSVSDQGYGITQEVMEHLFEPFFTTRGAQSGTGLGLAVVHGVVAEFKGAIDVQSVPGQGALFSLYLPECQAALDTAAAPAHASPGGKGQRIMVVDDEATLVDMALEMLEGLGYRPVGFTDPAQALAALKHDEARFAAVITDEVMPQMSGTQLTESLRKFEPDVPVLLVSGYGGVMLAARALRSGVTRVLNKPLQRSGLAQALSELLD